MPRQSRGTTLGDYFGKNPLPAIKSNNTIVDDNLVGLELEVENYTNDGAFRGMNYWNVETDGSLRNNGREFVLRGAMGGDSLNKALNELWGRIHEHGGSFHINGRTSLHVHLDLRSFTYEQIKMFFALYIIAERSLFRLAGSGRDKNIYCPATYEAYDPNVGQLLRASNMSHIDSVSQRWEKYTGINMTRCRDLNTVEIRIHNGTLNGTVARRWVNSLLTLAKQAKNPTITLESSTEDLINALLCRPTRTQRDHAINDIEDGLYNLEYYTSIHRHRKNVSFDVEVPAPVLPDMPMTAEGAPSVRTKARSAFRETYGQALPSRIAVADLHVVFATNGVSNVSDYIWRADVDTYMNNI